MSPAKFSWARRVPQRLIARLYALDAKGIIDDALIDEAGYAMYARCESIRIATEAVYGRVACHACGAVMPRELRRDRDNKSQPIECECGWATTWGEYHRSYQGKQLFGGNAFAAFQRFLEAWPKARNSRDKLLAIDTLIHACHLPANMATARPAATNLIEGSASELAAFLDDLAYGPQSTSGLAENRAEWKRLRAERWFPNPGNAPRQH